MKWTYFILDQFRQQQKKWTPDSLKVYEFIAEKAWSEVLKQRKAWLNNQNQTEKNEEEGTVKYSNISQLSESEDSTDSADNRETREYKGMYRNI